MTPPTEVTRLLAQCRDGDREVLSRLLPLVYADLRELAGRHLRRERPDHTLQPTALVHEAYLRLVDQDERTFENRAHFLAIAATAMRRILVNHAVARRAEKRGGGAEKVTLFEAASVFEERAEDLVALDEALDRFAAIDPAKCRIVELRFFAGLSADETAACLSMPLRSVERGWRFAKAWLRKEIGEPA
jgi:RNA polymerase sigma factor (TIGR02999 family)